MTSTLRSLTLILSLLPAPFAASAQSIDCTNCVGVNNAPADCTALREAITTTEAALNAVELDESTRRALAVRRELLNPPGAQIRLFPKTTGVDGRPIDLRELTPDFAAWKAAVDELFAPELAAQERQEAAEEPWADAVIALDDAIAAGHCGR